MRGEIQPMWGEIGLKIGKLRKLTKLRKTKKKSSPYVRAEIQPMQGKIRTTKVNGKKRARKIILTKLGNYPGF